jgi:uncharacterized membrane protein
MLNECIYLLKDNIIYRGVVGVKLTSGTVADCNNIIIAQFVIIQQVNTRKSKKTKKSGTAISIASVGYKEAR